jgi:predicted secreted protein
MKRLIFSIPLLAACSATACSREPRPYEDTFTYTDTSTYTDTAQAIRAAAGSEFQIILKSNQSTGYQWVLVDSAGLGGVRVVGTDYRVPRELRDRDGAGGKETWTLQAPRPGSSTVSLIYVRPWENTAPKDTTRFRVVID